MMIAQGASFTDELARGLYIVTGHRVPPGEWGSTPMPGHLSMNFVVEDARRRPLGDCWISIDAQRKSGVRSRVFVRAIDSRCGRQGRQPLQAFPELTRGSLEHPSASERKQTVTDEGC